MLYDLSMSESNKYESLKNNYTSTIYVVQEIPGTQAGNPKINIMGVLLMLHLINLIFYCQNFLN